MPVEGETDCRGNLSLAGCVEKLWDRQAHTDITFHFPNDGEKTSSGHRLILSLRSAVFEAMFFGPLAHSQDVVIEDVDKETFDCLLSYIYTDRVTVDGDTVLKCLFAAKKYCLDGLMSICNKYLSESITGDTVCTIYEQAKFFDMVDLANRCRSFIITNSASVFLEEDFTNLTRESLIDIFSDENLRSSELIHFKAACHWAQTACERRDKDVTPENMRNVLGEALKCIRFPLMSAEDFTKYVSQSDILSAPEQVLLFRHFIMKGFPSKECEFSALPRACTRLVTPVPNLEGDREVKLNQVVIKIEVSHDLHLVSFSMPKQEEIQSVLIVDENDREIPAKVPVFKKDSSSFVFDPPLLLCSKCAQLQVNLNRLTKVRNIYNKSLLTHESQTFFEDLQISHFKVKNRVYNFGEITVWVTMAPAKLKELVFKRGQW